jgi:hypothetical protein
MDERLIWRPNAITPDEWDNLGRDQQIKWWKDHTDREPKSTAIHPFRAAQLLREGLITKARFSRFVFQHLTDENVQEFLDAISADVLQQLREEADLLPANDDTPCWDGMIHIESGFYPPWVSADEIKLSEDKRRLDFRHGVHVFRTHS